MATLGSIQGPRYKYTIHFVGGAPSALQIEAQFYRKDTDGDIEFLSKVWMDVTPTKQEAVEMVLHFFNGNRVERFTYDGLAT